MHGIWFERPLPPRFLSMLAGRATPLGPHPTAPDSPLAALDGARAAVVGARLRFDGRLLDQYPGLWAVVRTGIGTDNVVLADATARRVAVCNVPDGPTISTAEHAVALIMATVKHLKRSDLDLRRGGITDFFSSYDGLELHGRRLGLVGMGRIGRRVARIALALEMSVGVYDPAITPEQALSAGVDLAPTLEALLGGSDVVSLHLPHTKATHHLVDARSLAAMKRGAYLVNTARGGLVDEAALLAALESGHLKGAGLDVFDPEPPPPDHPLLARDDVMATGHVASGTQAGKDRLLEGAIQQALQLLRGERPTNLVNPEVWPALESRLRAEEG